MTRNYLILTVHPNIFDNEDQIKSRKNCGLQIYIILCSL